MTKKASEKDQEHLATMKRNTLISDVNPMHSSLQQQLMLVQDNMRRLKNIDRMGTSHKIKRYSLAEHCYYVGTLFQDIARMDNIMITENETYWVFRHDLLETVTGDMMYPTKHLNSIVEKSWSNIEREIVTKHKHLEQFTDEFAEAYIFATEQSKNLFKACDLFELYLFCLEERRMGNISTDVEHIIYNCQKWIPPLAQACGATYIMNEMDRQWI